MSEKYFAEREDGVMCGAKAALRASLAWRVIERNALCTGTKGAEDSAGRASLELLPVPELVDRAFAIADRFVELAEGRGELLPHGPEHVEAAMKRAGELEKIRYDAAHPDMAELRKDTRNLADVVDKLAGKM